MLRITKKIFNILDKSQRKNVLVIMCLMLIGAVAESLSVSLIFPLVSAIMNTNKWNEAWYAQIICNIFKITEISSYVKTILLLLIFIFIMKNIFLLYEYYVQNSFTANCRYHMQKRLMICFLKKPYSFFLFTKSADIVRIVTSDTTQVVSLLISLLSLYTDGIICAMLGITIIIISPTISIILICILVFEVLIIAKIIKPIMKRIGERQRRESSLTYSWLLQSIHGIKSIKVARTESFFCDNYSKHAEVVANIERKNLTFSVFPRLFIEAFTVSTVLGFMLFLVSTGTDLAMLVPQLSAFFVAAIRLLPSVNRISCSYNNMPFCEGALDNIIEVLNQERKMLESNNANREFKRDPMCLDGNAFKMDFNSSLSMKQLDYVYPETEKKILDCANIKIEKGQSVGIVGTSGAGKTTAMDIFLGLLEPTAGGVFIDDIIDIRSNKLGWLSRVAYIPQQIFLIDDTIRNNVAFGVDASEIDENKVWKVLKEAQLDQFVFGLPDKLDTIVGEYGIRLSGGQRQRIGIARALYGDPEILFFDEATSALDNETEYAIMEEVSSLKGERTLIIIAHRLSTLKNCDVIFRVADGKVLKEV